MSHPKSSAFPATAAPATAFSPDTGVIDISARHGSKWPTLREVVEAGALQRAGE